MADGSHIEWTDATWNPITGCSLESPGCTNCYAMRLAGTRLSDHPSRANLTREVNGNHIWTGEVRFNEYWLYQPIRWSKPRMIFVCAHGDLFHENVPLEWIVSVFAVMIAAPQHTYQVLTKRSSRMREVVQYLYETEEGSDALCEAIESFAPETDLDFTVPPKHIWMGVSAEDQTRWDERVANLRETPAAVRWVSAEPLLGLIRDDQGLQGIDWIVTGGESSPRARPMHPDWARILRDQCAAADVPHLFKQWGEWMPIDYIDGWADDFDYRFGDGSGRTLGQVKPCADLTDDERYARIGKKSAGRLLDGIEHNGYPRQ